MPRARRCSWETDDSDWARIPPPPISQPPWGGQDVIGIDSDHRVVSEEPDQSNKETNRSNGWSGESYNWASAIPLPRLALLSGLTALRLNVSLAGVYVRVPSKGLRGDVDDQAREKGHGEQFDNHESPSVKASPVGGQRCSRMQRVRRCVRRMARQLVERIHPVGASPGYRQASRLFRDEMSAMGYDQTTLGAVLQALAETSASLRDSVRQDESKDENTSPSLSVLSPSDDGPVRSTAEMPDGPSTNEERDDVRELVEAGMSLIDKEPRTDHNGSDSNNNNLGDPALLDVFSIEVGSIVNVREVETHGKVERPSRVTQGCLVHKIHVFSRRRAQVGGRHVPHAC